MFDGLICGRLIRPPKIGRAKNGNVMATCLLRVPVEGAEDTALVSVIAFQDAAESLLSLSVGDGVAVSGPCHVREWQQDGATRHGVSITAQNVMSGRLQRKPKRMAAAPRQSDFDDAISF